MGRDARLGGTAFRRHRRRVLTRASVAIALAAGLSSACVSGYDVVVRDPREVEVREPLTGATVVPRGDAVPPAATSGARPRLFRRADGSLALTTSGGAEDVVLSAGGLVDGRASHVAIGSSEVVATTTIISGSKYRSRVALELVTPRSNVLDVREREAMNEPLGYASAASGAIWLALAGVFLFVPGLTVGKGSERRPMTQGERTTLAGVTAFVGVSFGVAGGVLLARGNPSTSVLEQPPHD